MSVRKRKWTTAKGEKKEAWVADYTDQTGKRHLKTFDRKKEADAYLAKTKVEVKDGVHTADSLSVTVAEAADLWLKKCAADELERATVTAYEQHVRLHIVPYLGRVKLSRLTAPAIREFEDNLRQGIPAPGADEGKARSPAMAKKIMASLGSILGEAQERGLVSRNVASDLRTRRKRGKQKQQEARHNGKLKVGVDIPTPDEIRAIANQASGRWRPFLLAAIFTGLRASELRGLKWSNIDFDKSELHVCQRADRYKEIGSPKSGRGHRSVPMPPIVKNTLREWKLACPKSKLDLVFPTGTGEVEFHSNIVKRGFMPVQIEAGVTLPAQDTDRKLILDKDGKPIVTAKYTGLHALRHFYASWCINRKADGGLELPPKLVQERLGHSTIMMTMDTYGHLFPRMDDADELAQAERVLLG